MGNFKVTILGSGTSQGVPVIACGCDVCLSDNEKDKRLRSSIMLSRGGQNLVIDAGPDFRQQMLREKVQTLEGIVFTHEHKDHVAGLDDVRAFNFKEQKDMPVYCSERVEGALKREFAYIFDSNPYPGIPRLSIELITNSSFATKTFQLQPIEVMHYKMPVFGFRIEDFCYITDAKTITSKEKEKLKGCKMLVVNALRKTEHISHFNLEQALAFIKEINPEKAYLTHISHLLGTHEEIEKELPLNVYMAYDGLQFEC
jgi:phosphoribosyl 1,2-cyclic phosphate phosphodiesterase